MNTRPDYTVNPTNLHCYQSVSLGGYGPESKITHISIGGNKVRLANGEVYTRFEYAEVSECGAGRVRYVKRADRNKPLSEENSRYLELCRYDESCMRAEHAVVEALIDLGKRIKEDAKHAVVAALIAFGESIERPTREALDADAAPMVEKLFATCGTTKREDGIFDVVIRVYAIHDKPNEQGRYMALQGIFPAAGYTTRGRATGAARKWRVKLKQPRTCWELMESPRFIEE